MKFYRNLRIEVTMYVDMGIWLDLKEKEAHIVL